MKTLVTHINEALKIGKDISNFSTYSCKPKTKEELEYFIDRRVSQEGPNCNLNDIDTSLITDMSFLFYTTDFNGDISEWNVSNVKEMFMMFAQSKFNGDISKWDVSNVTTMSYMFSDSEFNQDISNWKIKDGCIMKNIFIGCPIKKSFRPDY